MNPALPRSFDLPVPWILIVSVMIVSVLGWVIKPLQGALILNPFRVRHSGHVHRLLTAGWVHGSPTHLLFNMISLYFFAEPVLKALGPAVFLVLYISAVVLGFVPTTLRHMSNPKYNSLGASGAIAAVMFSAILFNPKMKLLVYFAIPVPAWLFAVGYLIYNVYQSRKVSDGVNHDAHFAGAIYGVIFTYVFEPARVTHALKTLF